MTKRHAWYVLLILTAINFLNYVDRQIIISLGPFIRRDLHLTYTGFGWLITAFMLVHYHRNCDSCNDDGTNATIIARLG